MPGLKAVLDTNVMIRLAFAQRGIAKTLRELLAAEVFALVTSADLLYCLREGIAVLETSRLSSGKLWA